MFERHYQVQGETGVVTIGGIVARVPHHPFWEKFARGWEADTERVFRQTIRPQGTVLDIGAWIGSTVLFALACDAARVVAVEPNPESFAALERMVAMNPELASRVVLVPCAVSDKREMLSMGLVEGEDDTSTSGIAGDDFTVQAETVAWLCEAHGLTDIDLIKIDIEGAELLLVDTLNMLSNRRGQVVHLSIHVPMFPQSGDLDGFIAAVAQFAIEEDRGGVLSIDEFRARILVNDSHPPWGTRHGNFFEVVLRAR